MQGHLGHASAWQRRTSGVLALAATFLLAEPASAQRRQGPEMPHPQLLIVMPAGGQAGTAVDVTLTGQDLDDPEGLIFSQPGIKGERLGAGAPVAIRGSGRRRAQGTVMIGSQRFKVTIPAGTTLGSCDVRLINRWGVSNPRPFVVGDLPEVLEREPNDDVTQAQRVKLNTTINGAISTPTDVDFFVFRGKKEERVVVSCLATSIDSRLHAGLQLYDGNGKELAYNNHYCEGDALVDCTLPADGDYFVRLFFFTYTQGTPEHFYRLTISTAPWIDAVFPPVVEPGKTAQVTVYGRNLPGGVLDPSAVVEDRVLEKATITVDAPRGGPALQRLAYSGHIYPKASELDGFELRVRNATGVSNPFLLTYARAPVVLDNGANDSTDTAQEVTLPCEIAGRIEKKRDRDWYLFRAKKGEVYSIEAYADRLGSPADLYFALWTADGKRPLVELDDNPENLNQLQFFTRSEDPPRYRFVVPADGKYQLMVSSRDASVQAGPRDYYRVRITPEEPDFRLVVMPASMNAPDACAVRKGGRQYYTVYVWRLDGWNGEITLAAKGLPAGVHCPPQTLAHDTRQATLVVSADPDAADWTGMIEVTGTATVNGQQVVREARPASITWPVPPQQGLATISRLDRNLVLAVRDKALFAIDAAGDKYRGTPGQRLTVPLKVKRLGGDVKGPILVTVLNFPPNAPVNNQQPVNIAPGKNDGSVTLDLRSNIPPGTYSVLIRGQTQVQIARDPKATQKINATLTEVSAPLSVTIVPKQLARVSLATSNLSVKAGKDATLAVRINRQFDFTGPFTLQLVLPASAQGIHANKATIAAGKDEAKLVLQVDEDAPEGNYANVTVRATADFPNGGPISQEAKFSLKVTR
jgi:hypothetical protein